MSETTGKNYMITGANNGIGLEATKQLALLPETKKVYMACRTESKALAAIQGLVNDERVPEEKLQFVPFDACSSKVSIETVVVHLPEKEPIHGLILNAGGMGSDASGKATGPNHVVEIFQINLVGHVHLVDCLQNHGHLVKGSRLVFSTTEAARGVPILTYLPPNMKDRQSFYAGQMDGTAFENGFSAKDTYSYVKGFGNLYFAAWARRNPDMTVLCVSPGGTRGTNVGDAKAMSPFLRMLFPVTMFLMGSVGLFFHSIETGAKRYVDAVNGQGDFEKFESGTYVASAMGTSGAVCDQAKLRFGEQYADCHKQEMCYEAIRTVVSGSATMTQLVASLK